MSREIKFRAWDGRRGKMIFGAADGNDSPSWVFTMYSAYSNMPELDITLEQSTGLKDKNGKEIYEGDIMNEDDFTFTIIWSEYTAKGDLDTDVYIVGFVRKWNDGEISPLGYYNGLQGEVIGNIHETKGNN